MRFGSEQLQRILEQVLAEKPEQADAIVWIQGDQVDRGPKVVALFRAGFAPRILVTGNNVLVGNGPRPGENDAPVTALVAYLLHTGVPRTAILVDDTAMNTKDQAENTIRIARDQGWKRILLVSSPYHQTRAFLTFQQAKEKAQSDLLLRNQPATDLPWDAPPAGREKTAAELLVDEEKKIRAYGILDV